MARVALQVPAGLVACIGDTALLLYRAAVEALHMTFGAHGETSASLEEVRRHRARLTELGALLDQLGWPGEHVPHALELTARRDVLRDALNGALIDAGERLAVACAGNWRGEASPDSVRVAAGEVIVLDRLLRELEAGEGP
jgi:hypothetical protein